ncbi:MAG: hypothetical protein MRJ65_02680 [Candidatus Brocadiaceae bacterium]|nr:hypothetical protein [Candidatus Brocadiaceae bacterium]
MENLKNRLDLLEMDLKKLEKILKEGNTYGTEEEWHHVLQKARKIEEFAIAQLTLQKYQKGHEEQS